MKIPFEENLPNLLHGTIKKISTETDYDVSDNGNSITIKGQIVVIREIKTENRVSEIRDYMPIEITILKRKLIKKTREVSFRLAACHLDFDEDYTVFSGDLELTNIEEAETKTGEFELILEET